MIDLKNPDLKLSDLEVIDAPSHSGGKVRPNFFRVKSGSETFVREKLEVTTAPKELYELFQSCL